MADVRLGPFNVGIDHISPEASMPKGSLRDAINMDIDREGNLNQRPGLTLLRSSDHAYTIWKSDDGFSYVQDGDTIYLATYDGALHLTAVATLNSLEPVSFTNLLHAACFSNRSTIGLILPDGSSRRLGVEAPGGFSATVGVNGGMDAGNYALAITYLVGEEEGVMSALAFVTVPANGGVQLGLPTPIEANVTALNVYMTQASGEIMYLRTRVPAGLASFLLGKTPRGRTCATQNKWRTPPGAIVRYWHGRLLVANGPVLRFSDPMRYGVTDPRHGFIQEARPIVLMEPVEGGVFVGTAAGVVFYRGSSPADWVREPTDGKPPIPFTGARVPANELGGDVGGSSKFVAMWLSSNGFVIGTVDGALVQPQATRIRLAANGGAMVVHHRKAVAVVS